MRLIAAGLLVASAAVMPACETINQYLSPASQELIIQFAEAEIEKYLAAKIPEPTPKQETAINALKLAADVAIQSVREAGMVAEANRLHLLAYPLEVIEPELE